jgi:hypothetical protein
MLQKIKKPESDDDSGPHGKNRLAADYFFAAFLAAHTAFNLAESLALAAALILRLPLALAGDFAAGFVLLIFAQRALAAAEILALAAALILNFFFFGAGLAAEVTVEPNNLPSSFSSDWIFSFNAAALRNC